MDKLGHDHALRHRRHHQGPGQQALITAIRNGRDVITWPDVIKASSSRTRAPEDVEYIERERHAVAVHEACHALVAFRTGSTWRSTSPPSRRAATTSAWCEHPARDQFTRWRSEYETDILVSLASLAASGCSSKGQLLRRVRGPGVRDHGRLVHGGFWGMAPRCPRTPRPSGSRSARRAAPGRHAEEGAGPRGSGQARARGPDRGQADHAARPDRADPHGGQEPVLALGARPGDAQDAERRDVVASSTPAARW